MMKKKSLAVILVLFLAFSFSTQAISAREDDLVIQDDGNVELIIIADGVLGASTTPKEPEKTTAPAPQSNPPQQHSEQKQASSPPPASNPASQAPAKTVPLVSPQTESTVHINPPINDDKKMQVTITTERATQPIINSSVKTQSAQTPASNTFPTTVITKNVDRVVAQGADGQPVITIKSDQAHQLTIQQGTTQVTTLLPLQIDTVTHALSVSSQKQPTISVLPSEALQGILDKGLLNTQNVHQAKINLTQDTNGVNYTVSSQEQGKLFGMFSVKSPIQITLSAQTGKVKKASQSFLFSFLGGFIK